MVRISLLVTTVILQNGSTDQSAIKDGPKEPHISRDLDPQRKDFFGGGAFFVGASSGPLSNIGNIWRAINILNLI